MADAGRGDGEDVQRVELAHAFAVAAVDRDPGLAVRVDRKQAPVGAASREDTGYEGQVVVAAAWPTLPPLRL